MGIFIVFRGGGASQAFAAVEGAAPNNTCASAQDLGSIVLPFILDGNLDGAVNPDVDFFKITGTPGSYITVNLQGVDSQKGTLQDPHLGVFNSSCQLVQIGYDNSAINSRDPKILILFPNDGIIILASTQCCDNEFNLGGKGTYQFSMQALGTINSISGRMVSASTGLPVPGEPSGTWIDLAYVGIDPLIAVQVFPDSSGNFTITSETIGQPLPIGNYQITASASDGTDFDSGETISFSVTQQGQSFNVGNVGLIELPRFSVKSVSGRVIDAVTGKPLTGNLEPFVFVSLRECFARLGCGGDPAGTFTDSHGNFKFTGNFTAGGRNLLYIDVTATQYFENSFQITPSQAVEQLDIGDVKITSFPLRYTNIIPCKKIPKQGGSCQYSVRVSNGLPTNQDVELWSIVKTLGIVQNTSTNIEFQPKANQRLALRPGETKKVSFDFPLPSTVDDGTNICANAYVGKRPFPAWNVVGFTDLFCMTKGQIGFTVLPEQKAHELTRKLR